MAAWRYEISLLSVEKRYIDLKKKFLRALVGRKTLHAAQM